MTGIPPLCVIAPSQKPQQLLVGMLRLLCQRKSLSSWQFAWARFCEMCHIDITTYSCILRHISDPRIDSLPPAGEAQGQSLVDAKLMPMYFPFVFCRCYFRNSGNATKNINVSLTMKDWLIPSKSVAVILHREEDKCPLTHVF